MAIGNLVPVEGKGVEGTRGVTGSGPTRRGMAVLGVDLCHERQLTLDR